MEFWFPVEALDPARLKLALDTPLLAPPFRRQLGRLDFHAVHGYLKGFVDLIFEHDGKWYVCDYKSNRLDDYGQEPIEEAMAHSFYFLQYLLYTVALHRYLRRLPQYDYDTHVGGVCYLFLRGMQPDRDGSGVFFARPERGLVEALDACMGGTP
jgi:exodeoxyribonuclease V beta subunit